MHDNDVTVCFTDFLQCYLQTRLDNVVKVIIVLSVFSDQIRVEFHTQKVNPGFGSSHFPSHYLFSNDSRPVCFLCGNSAVGDFIKFH